MAFERVYPESSSSLKSLATSPGSVSKAIEAGSDLANLPSIIFLVKESLASLA